MRADASGASRGIGEESRTRDPEGGPVDARELREGLAGMRDLVAELQLELETARRHLDDSTHREAELEARLAEVQPVSRPPASGGIRRRLRLARRTIERAAVRVIPRRILAFAWHDPLFDPAWYLERNPDVSAQRMGAERHYRRHGFAEGRDPNVMFDTSWYLERYADVAASGVDPLDHYHLFGAWEGRDPSPWFHTRWYLALNPDVAAAGIDPLLHYLHHGASEGRAARPGATGHGSLAGPRAAARQSAEGSPPASPGRRQRRESGRSLFDDVPPDRPIVIMLDDIIPRPDRDAGSLLIEHYVRLFHGLGYHVQFIALNDGDRSSRYRRALENHGASVVDVRIDCADLDDLLVSDGARIDVAFLSRVTVAGRHIEDVIRRCPNARIIFNTQDLHFLREERAARLTGDRVELYRAAALRELEIHAVRMADATIVVSEAEKEVLDSAAPGSAVYWCPLMQDVVGRTNGFHVRSGIAFVGGYRHLPNVDALRYFLDDVWPAIRRSLPDVSFYAIGADMPEELRGRDDEGFVAVGHVSDLMPWLERVRLTVAPLRFGAGMKGKVLSSLAHGVPCVVTPAAAEGIETDESGIVAAEGAPKFADAVVSLHEDAVGWEARSDTGLRWIDDTVSVARGRERLLALLTELGAPVPIDSVNAHSGGEGAPVAG